MKPKYLIGAVIALGLITVAVFTVESKKIEYMDFAAASISGEQAQIAGTWVKAKDYEYNAHANLFRFTMLDEKGTEMEVVYNNAKPPNFELSTMVVATGAVEGNQFKATHILTKCPSKYEADGKEILGSER